jgi:hypothetical protein
LQAAIPVIKDPEISIGVGGGGIKKEGRKNVCNLIKREE